MQKGCNENQPMRQNKQTHRSRKSSVHIDMKPATHKAARRAGRTKSTQTRRISDAFRRFGQCRSRNFRASACRRFGPPYSIQTPEASINKLGCRDFRIQALKRGWSNMVVCSKGFLLGPTTYTSSTNPWSLLLAQSYKTRSHTASSFSLRSVG